eukprot:scaffold76651_cov33-Phaeocystis_antarctica.AAC.1
MDPTRRPMYRRAYRPYLSLTHPCFERITRPTSFFLLGYRHSWAVTRANGIEIYRRTAHRAGAQGLVRPRSRAQIPSADSESAEACKKTEPKTRQGAPVAAPWGSNPYPSLQPLNLGPSPGNGGKLETTLSLLPRNVAR